MIIKGLATCLLFAVTALSPPGASQRGEAAPPMVKAGLADDTRAAPSAVRNDCAGETLSRKVKYGDSERNVLDVATSAEKASAPRPVLLFVAGESFADDGGTAAAALR